MAGQLVGDGFIAEYNELFEKVNGVGSSLTSRSGNDVPSRAVTIRVKINSIITSPTPAYVKGSQIQFKATQVDTDAAPRKWDTNGSTGEGGGVFTIKKPLYGAGLEFDYQNPAGSNSEYVGEEFNVEAYSFKDSGKMVRGWRVIVSTAATGAEFGLCTVTGEGANNKEYEVNVQVGNPKLTPAATLPKGILYLDFATTNAVAIGAKIQAILYPSTKTPVLPAPDTITYDCIAIETLYNLVSPPVVPAPAP